MAKAVAVMAFLVCLTFEGCGPKAQAQETSTGEVISAAIRRQEFANNLLRCVANDPINTCLGATLEDLRSLMPTGIPELGLRPTEPLQIENIEFKTRPNIVGVQIESEFSNVRNIWIFCAKNNRKSLFRVTYFLQIRVGWILQIIQNSK